MTEILENKLSLLAGILELTKQQAESFKPDALDQLEKIIADKQALIDKINHLDEEFGTLFTQLKGEYDFVNLGQAEASGFGELREKIKAVTDLISEIHSYEESNSKKAKELMERIKDDLRRFNQGRKMTDAYKQTPSITKSYFIDRKD